MSMSLDYRFTFITVLEDVDFERSAALVRRSRSQPPRAKPLEMCEAHREEEKDGRYVQDLTRKLSFLGAEVGEEIPSPTSSTQDTEDFGMEVCKMLSMTSNATTQESEAGSLLSAASNPGSVGHPELCRRPCIYFAQGLCRSGTDCNFCHMSHAHRSATLDKSQRQMLKELTRYELLSLLLRCLRNKAVEGSFELEAHQVTELFERRLSQEPVEFKVGSKVANLEKALARMTFFSVASLTTRAKFEQEFLDLCKTAVGKLRKRFE